MTLPLADVRIVAIEQFGAGPWGTLQLADLGAEIVKIEDPRSAGDVGRYVPPFQEGEDSLFFEAFNRGKRSVSLDLRHPEAPAVFHDLVRVCDGVYSNLRGDQPMRLGLTYEQLREVNPRIVCCSLSGFGMTGPRAAEGGYDYMMQGLAGWQMLTGDPDGPPTKSGLSLVDLSGGYASAIAMLAGIWRARRDGVGCDCDISLFETALHELMYIGPWAATHGYVPPRRRNSAHPTIVPFQNFEASDAWFVVGAAKQAFWERLCEVIGRPDLIEDTRFATMAGRNEHRDDAAAHPRGGLPDSHGGRVDRGAGRGGRPGISGQHGRPGAHRPTDGRPRGNRRVRPSCARSRAFDPDPAQARRGRDEPRAPGRASPISR